jgi:hypothetical protein
MPRTTSKSSQALTDALSFTLSTTRDRYPQSNVSHTPSRVEDYDCLQSIGEEKITRVRDFAFSSHLINPVKIVQDGTSFKSERVKLQAHVRSTHDKLEPDSHGLEHGVCMESCIRVVAGE